LAINVLILTLNQRLHVNVESTFTCKRYFNDTANVSSMLKYRLQFGYRKRYFNIDATFVYYLDNVNIIIILFQ